MVKDDDTHAMTQLQQWDVDERRVQPEHELTLAAEAHHRLCILKADRPRLDDLAGEWIELLRASGAKKTG
ncbi:MAG: hypothetical protein PVI91_10520 [Gammaproteobacteria bacterium]|jgi:hypothetical protein